VNPYLGADALETRKPCRNNDDVSFSWLIVSSSFAKCYKK